MKTNNFTITPYWDSRVMNEKTKKSRVLLTINLKGKQFRISIKLQCTKPEFESALNSRSVNAKELRKAIQEYIDKAEFILNKLNEPTKESFIRLFKSDTSLVVNNKTDVSIVFSAKVAELKKESRIGTSNNYRDALRCLKRYKSNIYFEDVDEKWLKGFVSFMIDSGNSSTTAQIYLRNLRTVFNIAIKQGVISEKHYPFKTYSIGSSAKSKSVLYAAEIKAFWNYKTVGVRETRAKGYWFFCYLCNGMNFKDACYLRWKNIKGDILTFVRQKTKNTTTDVKEIKLHLHDEAKRIIEEYGNESRKPDDFVFPLLKGCKTIEHMEKTRYRHKRVFNKKLATIGVNLGFDVHLCLNLARHSFATVLKVNGTPTSFISDAMGHTSSKTTEHYLKSIPTEQLKNISNSLLDF